MPEQAVSIVTQDVGSPVPKSFEERAGRLRLLVWDFDAKGRLKRSPGAMPMLLSAAGFQELLAGFLAQRPSEATEIAPGCWAFPVYHRRKTFVIGMSVAVGFEAGFLESALFEELCAATGTGAGVARKMMAALVRPLKEAAGDLSMTLGWMAADTASATANTSMIDQFSTKLSQAYEEVNFLFRLALFLNFVEDPVQMVQLVLAEIHQILAFKWVAVRFHPHHAVTEHLRGASLIAGELPAGLPLEESAMAMFGECKTDQWEKLLVPGQHPLATVAGAEVLADLITHDRKVIGILFAGNKSGDDPDLSSMETQLVDAIADFLGVFHENAARFAEQRTLFTGSLRALTSAIDAKDRYTRGHSERVGLLAEKMAVAMGLPQREIEEYRVAGLVHDVGKIGVPEVVLRKAGHLTDEEFAFIKEHPRIGHEILKDIPPLAPVLPGVLHHHERWDGKGYPSGLSGEGIPVIARVLALADTFDAMSSNRSYRSARTRAVTLKEIRDCAGRQFDPGLVEKFCGLDFAEFDAALARVGE